MGRAVVGIAVAVGLSVWVAAPGTEAAAGCRKGEVGAAIAGKRVCLRLGQKCLRLYGAQYRLHAFNCTNGRLTRWVITDLGTLGGKYSGAYAINDRGRIAGYAYTADGVAHAVLWENGKIRDLGTLGGKSSSASAINERGEIAGWSDTQAGESHAFLWRNGVMTDLGTLGGKESHPVAINDNGWIIGRSLTAIAGQEHSFVWRNGVLSDLGTLGGTLCHATDINAQGVVVGASFTADGDARAFRWKDGVMSELNTVRGRSVAFAISDRGHIVGEGSSERHAFLWRDGAGRDLGTLGNGLSSGAVAINERGQVLGWSHLTGDIYRGFVWQNGKMRDLGSLRGHGDDDELTSSLDRSSINERGQIVGTSLTKGDRPHAHAFVWANGAMTDLGALGGKGGASGGEAINERGQIIGYSHTGNGTHAVLWTLRGKP